MRIALYGGSFNPPHLGHQLACAVALASARPAIDEVWMVPTFQHAFGKPLAPFDDRYAMCEEAARVFAGRVRPSRIEEELGGPSYTLRTVRAIMERERDVELVMVIGADLVAERPRWHAWEELRELVSFLVIGRAGAGSVSAGTDGARDVQVPIELPAVSSTEVRRRIACREPTFGLLDERVRAHIERAALYRATP